MGGGMGKRAARYGLLTALAMVLSWVESMVPLSAAAPGMKLGLANLVVVYALYRMTARVALVSATFGSAYSFAYSLAGAVLSLAVMTLLKRTGKFSIVGVSAAGGVCHNIGQILVAMAVLGTARLAWYLPGLLAAGIAAGAATGVAGGIVVSRVKV